MIRECFFLDHILKMTEWRLRKTEEKTSFSAKMSVNTGVAVNALSNFCKESCSMLKQPGPRSRPISARSLVPVAELVGGGVFC